MNDTENAEKSIEVVFLGTAGAIRVPIFPSHCNACREAAKIPQARRLRSTLGIFGQETLIFDCGPDMGQIISDYDITSISRVFITHWHADHVFGISELDLYAILTNTQKIPIFMHEQLLEDFQNVYGYVQHLEVIPFNMKDEIITTDIKVVPIPANHEILAVGFFLTSRYDGTTLAYFPDTGPLPEETVTYLKDRVDIFIIDGTWGSAYPTRGGKTIKRGHMTIADASQEARRINSRRTILTHLSSHTYQEGTLIPQKLGFLKKVAEQNGVEIAQDGMRFTL